MSDAEVPAATDVATALDTPRGAPAAARDAPDAPPGGGPPRPGWLFVLATVLLTWPLAVDPTAHYTARQDFYLNLWILDWVARAVTTPGLDLFQGSTIFFPVGVGLETQPLSLPQSLTAVPLTLAAGPLISFHVLTLFGFWLAGWATCRWVTTLTGDGWAGLLAGLAFSFSVHHYSYIPQMGMAAIGFVPLFLWADLALTRRPGVLSAARAGLALAVVGMAAWYYGIIIGLTAAVLAARRLWRGRTAGAWRVELVVWGACALAMAPVVLRMLPAYLERPDMAAETEYRGLAPIIEKVKATGLSLPLSSYIGIVVLALALLGALRLRRRWGLVVMAVTYLLLSFGSTLTVAGVDFPTPYALLKSLPVVSNVRYPDRFFVAAHVALVALAGWGLADLRRRWSLRPGVLSVLVLLPVAEVWPGPLPRVDDPGRLPVPAASADDRRAVVSVPTTYRNLDGELLFHQTGHGRPVAGGYVTRRDKQLTRAISRDHALGVFAAERPGRLPADLAGRLAAEGVGFVHVQRGPWVAGTPDTPLSTLGPFALVARDYLRQRCFPHYAPHDERAEDAARWEQALAPLLGPPIAEGPRFALFEVPPR